MAIFDDNSVRVPCPECGKEATILKKEWELTFRDKEYWDANVRTHRHVEGSGPRTIIKCLRCKHEARADAWHRAYERVQLSALGWQTPRMAREAQTA